MTATKGKSFHALIAISAGMTVSWPVSQPTGASITYDQSVRNYPSYTVTGTNQLDPNAYTLNGITNNTQTYLTKEWSGGVNFTLPTSLFSTSEELKFGAAARWRSNVHTFNPYTSTAVPAVNMSQAISGGVKDAPRPSPMLCRPCTSGHLSGVNQV